MPPAKKKKKSIKKERVRLKIRKLEDNIRKCVFVGHIHSGKREIGVR